MILTITGNIRSTYYGVNGIAIMRTNFYYIFIISQAYRFFNRRTRWSYT